MAKLNPNPITAADLADFVATDSDFGFEMQVLARLSGIGFKCDYSATYRDPVTDKIRQFDIRAYIDDSDRSIALAVECKNLRENNPLLLSSTPRTQAEAFHDIFVRGGPILQTSVQTVHDSVLYPSGEQVGKKTDQVGRDSNDRFLRGDEATFEKLGQALNSCADLVKELGTRAGGPPKRFILPVLVVPTGCLWQVDYDAEGNTISKPRQVPRATLFINHTWTAPGYYREMPISYKISHVEIVTLDDLHKIGPRLLGASGAFP